MHDWTFVSLSIDWKLGEATLVFLNQNSEPTPLLIHGIFSLCLPRKLEWGMSVSVNSTAGPLILQDGKVKLGIEMQSGDLIEIVADSIILPGIHDAR